MSIKLLPGDVIAQIKSSVVITSLNGVVFGLLQNSLDAGASKISISIDYGRGNCTVEDNGLGIPPAEFGEDGGLGKLYYTSRYPPQPRYHGRHGTFLASLAALSLLSISSHHREYRSHNSLTIHNSKVVARNIPALPEQELLAHQSGTRVAVRDLFGSMPVRVRQRSIEAERLGSAKTFDQLVLSIVALLLPWHDDVALTIRDLSSGRLLSLSPQVARQVQNQDIPKSVTCFRAASFFTQASLADDAGVQSWVPLEASSPGISVVGCVSLRPVVTKRTQFIALGVQPLLNENQTNVLYEEVNKVFANSSFGAIEDGLADEPDAPKKTHGFTQKALKVRKGVDRWPMFFLNVSLEGLMERMDADELLDERRTTLAKIISLLQMTAYGFLKKHHFHPKSVHAFQELEAARTAVSETHRSSIAQTGARDKPARAGRSSSSRSRKTASSAAKGKSAVSPFATWSRLKSASASSKKLESCSSSISPLVSESGVSPEDERLEAPSSAAWNPLFSRKGQLLRKPFDDVEDNSAPSLSNDGSQSSASSTGGATTSEGSDNITWVDPATKVRALINPRTGFAVKSISATAEAASLSRRRTERISDRRRPPLVTAKPTANTRNQVFERTEAAIPCVPEISEYLGHDHNHDCRDLGDVNIDGPSGKISRTLESKISKDALAKAEVIQQVDRKFILVKIFVDGSPSDEVAAPSDEKDPDRYLLVLIDQHAADERCRVEELMEGYFVSGDDGMEAQIEALVKPLRFDLSATEGRLLERFREYFRYWGIRYELFRSVVNEKGRESGRVTVGVQALPTSIAERCRLEPRLLVELLRKEIWKLNDRPGVASGVAGFAGEAKPGDRGWVARFHQCPKGIVEMINSRSCRSAIMFNDVLTLDECRDLVRRLARCAFSFQCAHGRPSMVPLVDLGVGDVFGLGGKRPEEMGRGGLMKELKTWARNGK
ncbi:hypothetical protein QBC34DRAFT_416056 [Podospora aff. communis PSN243]|uniref:MutL C-terminal dimerisation domain-containing protein n=1 Tax=Podospora aff. communis PSN243 TaxID=3040156 RepID=A0AAV9G5I8_9PEZI|nr:hypothetical protein QBC34DRAFT_416056 [Podospora aff. communis PSN243]